MTKNPNRVKAGKQAWAKKSPTEKNRILRALTGRAPAKSKSGGTRMAAKKKGGGGSRRQSVASWIVNLITLAIGLSPVIARASYAKWAPEGQKWNAFASGLTADYTGFYPRMGDYGDDTFKASRALKGWAPVAGAIGFKTAMGMVLKKAPIKNLIPRLT